MGSGAYGEGAGSQSDRAMREVELDKFAPQPAVLSGDTADIYFMRTVNIL